MDFLTIERINFIHPKVRQEVLKEYQHINDELLGKGLRLRFTHTLRSFEEQKKLYEMGRSTAGKIVTNAKEGLSMHNYGLAFDIVLLLDEDYNGTFETVSWDITTDFDNDRISDWMEVATHFKKSGWNWGGDWKTFKDYPHLEKSFGFTSRQLLAKYKNGDTFIEEINGKIYTWVNL